MSEETIQQKALKLRQTIDLHIILDVLIKSNLITREELKTKRLEEINRNNQDEKLKEEVLKLI